MFAILFAIITSFLYPQEKVHVTTDREFYMSGDTVWMHSLLIDDIDTTQVHGRSRYLYVELRDLKDSLRNRVKLRATLTRVTPRSQGDERNTTLFSGYMPLPPTMESGEYTLVAYTSYMAGITEFGWFKKRLHVLTPRDVAYGFVPRVVMESDFIATRCDTVVDVSQPGSDLSLLSLTGLNERPQYIIASLNDNKYVPAAHTEPYIEESFAAIPDIYSPELVEALGGYIPPRNGIEVGQVVSGTVYGNWKKRTPQPGVKVDVFSADDGGYFDTQVTDSLGRFEFKGFELSDGASLTLMARKGKSGRRVMENIKVDPNPLPEAVHHKPGYKNYYVNRRKYEHDANLSDSSSMNADALMHLAQTSDVFQSYLLDEINIKGERQIKVKGVYSNLAEKSFDGELLEQQGVVDLAGAISRFPGIIIRNNAMIWRQMYVALFFDTMPEMGLPADEFDDYGFSYPKALNMPISSIARIDFLNSANASMIGSVSGLRGQPVISVTLRMGASRADMNLSYCTIHQPLGYQPMAHFSPNSSTRMFVAEMGMFLDTAESQWQNALRNLPSGSAHTLTIEGLDSTGTPFSRVIKIIDN